MTFVYSPRTHRSVGSGEGAWDGVAVGAVVLSVYNVNQNGEEVGQMYVRRIMLYAICFPSLTVLEKALVLVDGSAREWAADSEPSILS